MAGLCLKNKPLKAIGRLFDEDQILPAQNNVDLLRLGSGVVSTA